MSGYERDPWRDEVGRFARTHRTLELRCGLTVRAYVSTGVWADGKFRLRSSAVNGWLSIDEVVSIDGLTEEAVRAAALTEEPGWRQRANIPDAVRTRRFEA